MLFFFPVCLWSSGPASEGRRLHPGPAGKIPGLPQPPRAPRRPQRHVRPHAAEAAGHRGEVLRQRGLLQTLPAGQWGVGGGDLSECTTLPQDRDAAGVFGCVTTERRHLGTVGLTVVVSVSGVMCLTARRPLWSPAHLERKF